MGRWAGRIFFGGPVFSSYYFDTCIDIRSRNALPIPRDDVLLQDIIAFKKKRRDELLNFRQQINQFHKDLWEAEDRSHVKDVVANFSDSIEKGLIELGAILNDSKLGTTAGSFKSLFNNQSGKDAMDRVSGGAIIGFVSGMVVTLLLSALA